MKVKMIMAHPDDEILFGWPIFQAGNIEKEILICSSDLNNERRKWCSHRKFVLFDICKQFDIPVECLDYNSGFYKMETREESMSRMLDDVKQHIRNSDADYIFTHNPMGEYGHYDHKLLFHNVLENSELPILITDMIQKVNWPNYNEIPKRIKDIYYTDKLGDYEMDKDVFKFCVDYYVKEGAWTWSEPPITKCSMYRIK